MERRGIKRYIWQPIAMFCAGLAFYIYYGIEWNAWIKNLPLIIIYAFIIIALWWALRKKDELANKDY